MALVLQFSLSLLGLEGTEIPAVLLLTVVQAVAVVEGQQVEGLVDLWVAVEPVEVQRRAATAECLQAAAALPEPALTLAMAETAVGVVDHVAAPLEQAATATPSLCGDLT